MLNKLGAESLDYSTRKNNKYMATLQSGKKVHFGSSKYPDNLSIKTRINEISIFLELKRLKINRES